MASDSKFKLVVCEYRQLMKQFGLLFGVEDRRVFYEKNLVFAPFWIKGQVNLGVEIVEQLLLNRNLDRDMFLILIEKLKLCSLSIFELTPPSKVRPWAYAQCFLFVSSSLERKYDQCLASFAKIIKDKGLDKISNRPKFLSLIIEQAAASAMSLGKNKEALNLLQQIPKKFISKEVELACSTLNQPKDPC